jgi:hypothetical protein
VLWSLRPRGCFLNRRPETISRRRRSPTGNSRVVHNQLRHISRRSRGNVLDLVERAR